MKKILIVEDEKDIAQLIEQFFQANQFMTHLVHDGLEVINSVKTFAPDIIILDISLPNVDGIQCCQTIRQFSEVPIIMVTAKKEEIDRLKGLAVGADDYVCKPFSAPELVMRAQTILRRCAHKETVVDDRWLVDKAAKTISFNNSSVHLTLNEFNIFYLLFSSPGRIFSREQLINFNFNNKECSDRAIDSHIKNIRKQFKKSGLKNTVIESVYGAGYRFKKED